MKAIDLHSAQIERVSSRKDHSIGFSVSTPELTPEAAACFLQLHGVNVRLLIQPQDISAEDLIEVKGETMQKTPSQRLRAVLYVEFKDKETTLTFPQFYEAEMEKIISERKRNLPPM